MSAADDAPGRRGTFITIEGGEGGGKSTQSKALTARLRAAGLDAMATREPGGSPAAEMIRAALLAGTFRPLGAAAEALLFAAARIDHIDLAIEPALAAGRWVVCDRFHDSTRAYQGMLGSLDAGFLRTLERVTLAGLKPNLTVILDLPARTGLARVALRRQPGVRPDRFEEESLAFHQALRQAFLSIAAGDPDRCVVVDATQAPDEVEQAIWDAVSHRFAAASSPGQHP